MLVTDKLYFTSTLIAGAGCGSDTFRAWRNRNGLFPETSGGGKWNKFSIIDIFVVSLVNDLTRSGLSAQFAVDAAMKAAPLLEVLFHVPLTKREVLWPSELISKIERKIWPGRTDYPVLNIRPPATSSGQVKVELLTSQTSAETMLRNRAISISVNLLYLSRAALAGMAIADSELEIDGKKRFRPGHAKLSSGEVRQPQSPSRRFKAGD
ncbi:hypothetical protein [Bradyrhizobium barranii]|uniref:Uncharacterized protein n=1 Tax=Bradyrhizobium barranii subsp. barranii TaxID=2823807 RepID=A0A939RXP6_9BRAD|nr:hypothetical protein [Bradyrhizobium barranii]UEM14908.1 hypothetical protein J4G43_012055 [Bradyrhizobium barranii subsp. barranii]